MKAMLAHVVVTYDIKSENLRKMPNERWFGRDLVPDRAAEVLFRRRHE